MNLSDYESLVHSPMLSWELVGKFLGKPEYISQMIETLEIEANNLWKESSDIQDNLEKTYEQ